jgi:outer membrane receptor for ferrienterochelin and colicins
MKRRLRQAAGAAACLAVPAWAWAQAAPAASAPERVEITGQRAGDSDARRESTAAKIVVGRDEIERHGDSSLADIVKRLPGVTVQGNTRRGRTVSLRGLGGGYTQFLLDGERLPSNFSLDALDPDQIERIEILRAPSAETGARAIAGSINFVTRQGSGAAGTQLRLSAGGESGQPAAGLSWANNGSSGTLRHNTTLALNADRRVSDSRTVTTTQRLADDTVSARLDENTRREDRRNAVNLGARLQWRDEAGDGLTLTPQLNASETRDTRTALLVQDIGGPAPYTRASSTGRETANQLRLGAAWRHTLDEDTRLDLRSTWRTSRTRERDQREEFGNGSAATRRIDDDMDTRDRRLSGAAKISHGWSDERSLVLGAEAEGTRRDDRRRTLQDGLPLLTGFGDTLQARSTRSAVFVQDEWTISPRWSTQAGLRWEGITTRGDGIRHRDAVWSPLLHALWRPDPASRSQWRASLTRSWRAPRLGDLLGRPVLSTRWPVPGANRATAPDRVGNPGLRPELATGFDLAYEHYLPAGGMLGVNVFQRRIRDLMRSVTTLEPVSWADVPRWVSRPVNQGRAVSQGIELEARMRSTDLWAAAPALNLRANLSLFRSRVSAVAGPDNRLDQQPDATANLGVDGRVPGWPLTLGASMNWTPAYRTHVADDQFAHAGRRVQLDSYAVWRLGDGAQLRLSANNVTAPDLVRESALVDPDEATRETARTSTGSALNWQLRLELKL